MAVLNAKLSVYKNGVQYRVLDAMDADMGGDHALYIQDLVLGGGCQVAMEVGDYIDFRHYLTNGLAGDQLLGHPTSVYGYCGGFRLRCDTSTIDNPETGDAYVFV
jgi:hypothetical protein